MEAGRSRDFHGDHSRQGAGACGAFAAKPFVSRVHAKLSISGGRVFIEDMGATNHTYVNGELVTGKPRELLDGNVVGLGGSSPDDETQRGAAYFTVRICR